MEPGDIEGLARALERLATDQSLRARLGDAARARHQTFPTWAQTAARFFALLREVAAGA